jgi:Ca2+/Na+ antiporter
MPELTATMISF